MFRDTICQYAKAGYAGAVRRQPRGAPRRDARSTPPRKLNGDRPVWRWSLTEGWVNHDGQVQQVTDPVMALGQVPSLPEDSFLILRDLHFFLDAPEVIRKLRDILPLCKATGRVLVFVSPRLHLPVELQKDITVLDFSLPDREAVGTILDGLIESVQDGGTTVEVTDRTALLDAALGLTVSEAENAFALALVKHKNFNDDAIKTVHAGESADDQEERHPRIRPGAERRPERGRGPRGAEGVAPRPAVDTSPTKRRRSACRQATRHPAVRRVGLRQVPHPEVHRVRVAAAPAPPGRGQRDGLAGRTVRGADADRPGPGRGDGPLHPVDRRSRQGAGRGRVVREHGRRDHEPRDREAPHLDAGTQEARVRRHDRQQHQRFAEQFPELLRKGGRFDEVFFVDLPTLEERVEIFAVQIARKNRDPKQFDLARLATLTEGFSGAEIEECVTLGLLTAFDKGRDLKTEDIERATSTITPLSLLAKDSHRRAPHLGQGPGEVRRRGGRQGRDQAAAEGLSVPADY